MASGTMIAIAVFAVLCTAILLMDLARGYRRRAAVGLVLLAVFLIGLYVTTGFPSPSARVAFGATIPAWWAVVAMFVGIAFGMIAQYVWSKPDKFAWMDFLRPIVVSPLVLLPLIGSLQSGPLETIQILSLGLLAFQNGFFWQQVLNDAKPRTV